MKYKIEISLSASRDLREAAAYIAVQLRNPSAGRKLIGNAIDRIDSLEEFPMRYPLVQDSLLSAYQLRLAPVQNYLLFYQIDESSQIVHIIRFLYGKSDWTSVLKAELPLS